jgi:ATP-binding cassette subfamily G (WHITE) protein 2 (PDR)
MSQPGGKADALQTFPETKTPIQHDNLNSDSNPIPSKEEVDLSEYSDESPMRHYEPITTGGNGGMERTFTGLSRQRSEVMIEDLDRRELQRIVTELSRRQSSVHGNRPGIERLGTIDENDPAYDPESKDFDLEKWIRAFIQKLGDEGITSKRTGVTYKNLNVSGSGAALQLQETVGSTLTSIIRPGQLFSFGKKEPKHILRNFDGVLKSGELLIVLGRPGSGCSTLLKSLTGELHGLTVEANSLLHYNGIPQKKMIKEFKGETVYNQEVCRIFSFPPTACPWRRKLIKMLSRSKNTSLILLLVKRWSLRLRYERLSIAFKE